MQQLDITRESRGRHLFKLLNNKQLLPSNKTTEIRRLISRVYPRIESYDGNDVKEN